jgi:hypothetical protein
VQPSVVQRSRSLTREHILDRGDLHLLAGIPSFKAPTILSSATRSARDSLLNRSGSNRNAGPVCLDLQDRLEVVLRECRVVVRVVVGRVGVLPGAGLRHARNGSTSLDRAAPTVGFAVVVRTVFFGAAPVTAAARNAAQTAAGIRDADMEAPSGSSKAVIPTVGAPSALPPMSPPFGIIAKIRL